jgi:hypothetical protein
MDRKPPAVTAIEIVLTIAIIAAAVMVSLHYALPVR